MEQETPACSRRTNGKRDQACSDSIASKPDYAPWTADNTVVGIWMGVNDVGNSFYQSNVTDIISADVDAYFEQMQILYDAGLRRFAFLSVPRKSSLPSLRSLSPRTTKLTTKSVSHRQDTHND